jgi:hypothetical protein
MKCVVLGHDPALRDRLVNLLRSLGGKKIDESWGVAGGVELVTVEVELPGGRLKLESDNWEGLSISGPDALVDQIEAQLG